jgi:hypothetical protein
VSRYKIDTAKIAAAVRIELSKKKEKREGGDISAKAKNPTKQK